MPLPLLIPGIMAGVGALGGIFGDISAGNAAAKAEKQLRERRAAAERQYNQEANTDFLDTATAKSTLAALRRQNDKQMESAGNDAVKQGASDEAKVAMAGRLNENYADAASRLAGFGTQYQQQIKDRYQRRVDSLDDAIYNSQLNKPDALSTIGDAISGLSDAGMQIYAAGGFDKKDAASSKASSQNGAFTEKTLPHKIGAQITSNPFGQLIKNSQADFLLRNQSIFNKPDGYWK